MGMGGMGTMFLTLPMRTKALDKRQIRRNFLVEDGIAAFEGAGLTHGELISKISEALNHLPSGELT